VHMPRRIVVVCQLSSSKGRWAGVEWYVVLDGFLVFKWLLWIDRELVLDMQGPSRKLPNYTP
jgi:hypothetical protein